MAVLYATGWEAGSTAWYFSSAAGWFGTSTAISSAAGDQHRTAAGFGGNYIMDLDDAWGCLAGTVVAGTALWFHTWMKPNTPGLNVLAMQFARGTTAQITVIFRASGNIEINRGGTLLSTAVAAHNPNVSHWVAIECVAANVGGVVNVYVDDVLAATASGDTQAHATLADWDCFGFAGAFSSGGVSNNGYDIDDLIITDSTTGKVVEHYIVPIVPNGDSSPLTLTPSTGVTHFNLVDEIPASDVDYNSTAVSGDEDLYTMSNPGTLSTVLCAVFCARATRDGALTQGQVSVKSGATTVYSTAQTLPATPSYLDFQYLLDLDPDTGLAWSSAGITSVESGFKITT